MKNTGLKRFASLSAIVLATVLLSSVITYGIPSQQVFAQESPMNITTQTQQQQVTTTEESEILDNLLQAEQAIIMDNELMALAKMQNIRNIITGEQNLTIVVVFPPLSPNAAISINQTNVMNDTAAAQNNFAEGTTTTTTTEGTIQGGGNNNGNNNNNIASSPTTATDTTTLDDARIVPVQQLQTNQDTRTFRVTFDTLHVNVDHDPFSEGEWVMDVYVNDQVATLWDGSVSVNNEETIQLTENNQLTVTVPATNGKIMLTTAGWENDLGFDQPPTILAELLDETTMSFDEFTRRAQSVVAENVGGFQANDPNGYVEAQFTAAENFGVGQHRMCSQPNEIATPALTTLFDQTCDFELEFTIEEVQQ